MYASERWRCIHKFRTECVIPTCIPGCRYLVARTETIETYRSVFCGHQITETISAPHCKRIDEYKARRATIIDHALSELDRVTFDKGWRAGNRAYNALASEFYDVPCPFFEPLPDADQEPPTP